MFPELSDAAVEKLLFARDEAEPAELAMVFGAASPADMERRVRHAAGFYWRQEVPKLLLTGGGTLARTQPEALAMREIALNLGIPEESLLVESQSSNTFANCRLSLELLKSKELLDGLRTILLVSSEWHMKRVLLTMRQTFPLKIRLLCCPTPEGINRSNWTSSPEGRAEVLRELAIFRAFQSADLLPEIDSTVC